MQNFTEFLAQRVNLSIPRNFFLALAVCVFVTCMAAQIVAMITFNLSNPNILASYGSEIRLQVLIITFIIASLFFHVFLNLIKNVDQLRTQLASKVRYDDLTGTLSREAFLTDFDQHNSTDQDDALLIIDADFFKRINDNYGHSIGDAALVAITKALKSGLRESDKIGRIGGEEFAVHLKNIDIKLALDVAERLRKNVKKASSHFTQADVDLSVSIGAVIYKDKIDLQTLMKKADDLLYKAKHKGRNRVEHIMLQTA